MFEFADFGKWSSYIGPQGTYHNALLEGPDPSQGPTGLGCVTFALFLYGNNLQKPPELMQALRRRHLLSDTRRESHPCDHGRPDQERSPDPTL